MQNAEAPSRWPGLFGKNLVHDAAKILEGLLDLIALGFDDEDIVVFGSQREHSEDALSVDALLPLADTDLAGETRSYLSKQPGRPSMETGGVLDRVGLNRHGDQVAAVTAAATSSAESRCPASC